MSVIYITGRMNFTDSPGYSFRTMIRFLGALVTLFIAVALLVLTWPQLFGLEMTFGIAQVVAMRGLFTACCAVAAILFLVITVASRKARAFAGALSFLLVLATVANAGILYARGIDDDVARPVTDRTVTVLSWNTLGAAPGVQEIAKLAISSRADVIALPETLKKDGIAIATIMREAGSPMWVHTSDFGTAMAARSTTVLISPKLGNYEEISSTYGSGENTSVVPSIVMAPTSGDGPTIIASHAVSPTAQQMSNWRDDLRWLASQCSGDNVIIAGDFNATLDSIANLGTNGGALGNCHDAALDAGSAAVGTWPTDIPALLGSPIDHVFATANWKVTGMRVHTELDKSGSDHRPITVTLEKQAP